VGDDLTLPCKGLIPEKLPELKPLREGYFAKWRRRSRIRLHAERLHRTKGLADPVPACRFNRQRQVDDFLDLPASSQGPDSTVFGVIAPSSAGDTFAIFA
jgi:hypothetical protein